MSHLDDISRLIDVMYVVDIKFTSTIKGDPLGMRHADCITKVFTLETVRQFHQKHRHVSMKAMKNWAHHILEGLNYFHNHNPCIIHIDLNCNYIFVNGNSGGMKIKDLGFDVILTNDHVAHTIIFALEFMAPKLYEEDYN